MSVFVNDCVPFSDGSDSDCSDLSMLEVDSDIEERIQAAMAAVSFDDQLDKCIQWVRDKQAEIDGRCDDAQMCGRFSWCCFWDCG